MDRLYGAGLSLFSERNFIHYNAADGLAHNQLYTLAEDRGNRLLIGTSGGVSRFDGFAFQNLLKRDGLSSNVITSALMDRDGFIWVATNLDGVTRLKPTSSPPPIFLLDVVTDLRHGPI